MSNLFLKDCKKITLEETPKQILIIRGELEELKFFIMELVENYSEKEPEELMTRQEVADWFRVDPSTVHNWTVQGRLTKYGIENTVRYRRSEIIQSLKPLK